MRGQCGRFLKHEMLAYIFCIQTSCSTWGCMKPRTKTYRSNRHMPRVFYRSLCIHLKLKYAMPHIPPNSLMCFSVDHRARRFVGKAERRATFEEAKHIKESVFLDLYRFQEPLKLWFPTRINFFNENETKFTTVFETQTTFFLCMDTTILVEVFLYNIITLSYLHFPC